MLFRSEFWVVRVNQRSLCHLGEAQQTFATHVPGRLALSSPAAWHGVDDDPFRPQPLHLPGVPPILWTVLREAAGAERIALVGGAVRDWLLHHQHLDPWRGLVDLDLVIEAKERLPRPGGGPSPAWRLVERLSTLAEGVTVRAAQIGRAHV